MELKDCPFCGGTAARLDIDEGENQGGTCIECTECGACSQLQFERKETLVEKWNNRVRAAPALEPIGEDAARAALFIASGEEPDEPLIRGPEGTAWIKFSTAEKAIAAIVPKQPWDDARDGIF